MVVSPKQGQGRQSRGYPAVEPTIAISHQLSAFCLYPKREATGFVDPVGNGIFAFLQATEIARRIQTQSTKSDG